MSHPVSSRRRPSSRVWWIVGALGVLAATAVAIWFGVAASSGKVLWTNNGHRIDSDEQVTVRFDIRRDPSRAVVCVLKAQDEHHANVGTGLTTIPPGDDKETRETATVRTKTRALTGYVDQCYYQGETPRDRRD